MTLPITAFVDITVALSGAQPDKFSFGNLIGIFTHTVNTNRQNGPYPDLASLVAAGFTSIATPEIHAWASAAFAQQLGVKQVLVGKRDGADPTWTATMDAVYAAGPANFYGINTENRDEADILLVAAWTEANSDEFPHIYIPQSQDAAILAGTAGNVALDLQAANYHRTGLIYHRFSDANDGAVPADGYLDGAWSSRCLGFNLDAPNGVGNWKYKELSSVTGDPLTLPQATEIWDANANLFSDTRGLTFTSNGTMASGRKIDVQTSLDWIKIRNEEALLAAFVGEPTRIAFTGAGINKLKTVSQGVLDQGESFGHLSPEAPPRWTVPKIQEISAADKSARVLTMSAILKLTGAIEKLVMNFTVEE